MLSNFKQLYQLIGAQRSFQGLSIHFKHHERHKPKVHRASMKGKQNGRGPIDLSSEEDEGECRRRQQELQYRYQITKALLLDSKANILLAVTRELLPGTKQHKQHLLEQMIIHFFMEKIGINVERGHYFERMEANPNLDKGNIYESKYLMYGIDLLSNQKLFGRFAKHSPKITRINGSHCLLQFSTFEIGYDFIRCHIKDYSQEAIIPFSQNPNILAKNWVQLNTYMDLVFVRQLFIRNLTELDKRMISAVRPNDILEYEQLKQHLFYLLLENEKIKHAMEDAKLIDSQQQMGLNQQNSQYHRHFHRNHHTNSINKRIDEHHQITQFERQRSRTREKERKNPSSHNHYPLQNQRRNPKGQSNFNPKKHYYPNHMKNSHPMPMPGQHINPINNQNPCDRSYTFPIHEVEESSYFQNRELIIMPQPPKETPLFSPTSKFQEEHSSSDFHQVQNRLNAFNFSSSQLSSIGEKSKHQLSQIKLSEENRHSSNQISSNYLHSNQFTSNEHNLRHSGHPCSPSIISEEIIEKKSSIVERGQESEEDDDIYRIFQIPKLPKSHSNEVEPNFKVNKKPLLYNEVIENEQPIQVKAEHKRPRKKKVESNSKFIDLC